MNHANGCQNLIRILTFLYDPLGRPTTMNPASSDIYYQYDAVSRLQMETQHFAGSVGDGADTLGYNPASQIVSEARTNNAFVYAPPGAVSLSYTANGLNQYTAAGGASLAYDADGNLSNDGSSTYGYDAENRLISATGAKTATLAYDPLGRLWQTTGPSTGTTTFIHDGDEIAVEMNASGALLRQYMWGPGIDQPIVWEEGPTYTCGAQGAAALFVLHADHEGSVIARADCWGDQIGINTYDEHGTPAAANAGRFGYTGQAWIPSSVSGTTRPGSIPPPSAASSRPTRWATRTRSTSTNTSGMTRSTVPTRPVWPPPARRAAALPRRIRSIPPVQTAKPPALRR